MVLVGRKSRINSLFAAIMCLGFSAVGFWVAIASDPDSISGGLPFVPQPVNAAIGKGLFGVGALITLGIAIYAFREWQRGGAAAND